MRQRIGNWLFGGVFAFACGLSVVNLFLIHRRENIKQREVTAERAEAKAFNAKTVPLYQRKAQLLRYWIEVLLNQKQYQFESQTFAKKEAVFQIQAILDRIPSWEAKTSIDIAQMNELMVHLDTHWSGFLIELSTVTIEQVNKSLEPIERQIRELHR